MNHSEIVDCFCEEMRAPFDGVLPEISLHLASKESMAELIALLVANAHLPSSTIQREGSRKREPLAGKVSAKEVTALVQSGNHILLKKVFGLPDLGVGVLEDTVRLDFRTGPEWSDEQIDRLVHTLQKLREKVSISEIYLDEMEEHFSRDGSSGFQELLENG